MYRMCKASIMQNPHDHSSRCRPGRASTPHGQGELEEVCTYKVNTMETLEETLVFYSVSTVHSKCTIKQSGNITKNFSGYFFFHLHI